MTNIMYRAAKRRLLQIRANEAREKAAKEAAKEATKGRGAHLSQRGVGRSQKFRHARA